MGLSRNHLLAEERAKTGLRDSTNLTLKWHGPDARYIL